MRPEEITKILDRAERHALMLHLGANGGFGEVGPASKRTMNNGKGPVPGAQAMLHMRSDPLHSWEVWAHFVEKLGLF